MARYIPWQAAIKQHAREPIETTHMPDYPWQKIAIDFCGPFPSGELLLVAIDGASWFPEVDIVKCTNAQETFYTSTGKKMFAQQGNEFKLFYDQKGITHRKITPRWPEANGLVENFNKDMKKVAKTAHTEGKDWKREIYSSTS